MVFCRESIEYVTSLLLGVALLSSGPAEYVGNICFTLMTSFPLHFSVLAPASISQPASPVRSSPSLEKAIAPPLQPRKDPTRRHRSNSSARNANDHLSWPETRPCSRPSSGGRRRVRILAGKADGRDELLGNVASQRRHAAHLNARANGKIERWHRSLKSECIRPGIPLSLDDAQRLVQAYVEHYNNIRLNSAIGYITPKDMLIGHQQEIRAERDRKLEAAREQRKNRRQQAA
jgi:Integrase core domain